MIGKYPGVPAALAWAVVLVVVVLLCSDAESRDYLLGHGKALSVCERGGAAGGVDDDDRGMVGYLLKASGLQT